MKVDYHVSCVLSILISSMCNCRGRKIARTRAQSNEPIFYKVIPLKPNRIEYQTELLTIQFHFFFCTNKFHFKFNIKYIYIKQKKSIQLTEYLLCIKLKKQNCE